MSDHGLAVTSEAFEGPVLLPSRRTPRPISPMWRELCPDEALGSIRAKSA